MYEKYINKKSINHKLNETNSPIFNAKSTYCLNYYVYLFDENG